VPRQSAENCLKRIMVGNWLLFGAVETLCVMTLTLQLNVTSV